MAKSVILACLLCWLLPSCAPLSTSAVADDPAAATHTKVDQGPARRSGRHWHVASKLLPTPPGEAVAHVDESLTQTSGDRRQRRPKHRQFRFRAD